MSTALARPLDGLTLIEFEGLGPGPLAGRMLADLGATIILLVRPGPGGLGDQLTGDAPNPLRRGKQLEAIDLKAPDGRARALALIATADGLIEGYRPGVMERLGLGPADCAALNPRLVYGRMTGWGQTGPLATAAGHDLNYVALTGLLSLSARDGGAPLVPPTVMGDAPGALGLAFGMAAALLSVARGGPGRVVDAAIVDIVALLGTLVQWLKAGGQIAGDQPSPFHDSPFYEVYACADGFITLGALEPQFYRLLLARLGLSDVDPATQYDSTTWPGLKARLSDLFATRTRAEWAALLEGTDACFAPVLGLAEAAHHPHIAARGLYTEGPDGTVTVAPAPRFAPLAGVPSDTAS